MGNPIRSFCPSAAADPQPHPTIGVDELKGLHDQLAAQIDGLCDQIALRTNPSFMPAMPPLPSPSPSRVAVIAAIEGQRCRLDFLALNSLIAHDAFSQMERLTRDLVNTELGLPPLGRPQRRPSISAPVLAVPPPPPAPQALSDASSDSSEGEAVDGERPAAAQRRARLFLGRTSLVAQADELLDLHRTMAQRVERDFPRPVLSLDASEDQIEDDLRREGETLRHLGRLCRLAADGFEGLERRRRGLLRPEATLSLSDLPED